MAEKNWRVFYVANGAWHTQSASGLQDATDKKDAMCFDNEPGFESAQVEYEESPGEWKLDYGNRCDAQQPL